MTNKRSTGRVAILLLAAWCLSALSSEAMDTAGATIINFDMGRSDSTTYVAAEGGVFKRTSGGASWADVSSGIADRHIISVAVDPTNSNVAYASPVTGGIYKTVNGGSSGSTRASPIGTAAPSCASTQRMPIPSTR